MNQFRFRTIGSSLALTLALLAGACSSSQSVTTEPVSGSPSDTTLSGVSTGSTSEDSDIEPVRDELAEPINDSIAEPEEWPEPLPEPQLEPEPEPGAHAARYCAAYERLEDAGGTTPATPAEAEALLATMLMEVEVVVVTAPDNIAPSAAEMSKFIEVIAQKAAAENWDPQWFEDLEEDVLAVWGFDLELIESFFDNSDDLCNDARTTPLPEEGDIADPMPPVD